jgi:hypothetical protein
MIESWAQDNGRPPSCPRRSRGWACDRLGGLDRLGVDDRRGRGRRAAGRDAALDAQPIMHPLGRAGFRPPVQHVIDRAERREAARHGPPLDAFLDQVADRVHDVPAAALCRPAAPAGLPGRRRQRRLGDLPLASLMSEGYRGTRALRLIPPGQHRHGTGDVAWGSADPVDPLVFTNRDHRVRAP